MRARFFYHILTKTVAVLLATVLLFAFALSVGATVLNVAVNGWESTPEEIRYRRLQFHFSGIPHTVAYYYDCYSMPHFQQLVQNGFEDHSFTCTIKNEEGEVLFSNHLQEAYDVVLEEVQVFYDEITRLPSADASESKIVITETVRKTYLVTVYGKAPAEGSNFQTDLWWILKAHQYRKAAIACGVGSFLGFLLLTIYLCTVSGKRSRDEKPRCNLWDRIPTELYLIGVVGFLFVQLILLDNTSSLHWFTYLLGSTFLAMDSFLMVVSIVSLSTRIKTGAIVSGTLTVRLVCFLKKALSRFWKNMFLVPKVILVLGLVAAFDLFLATFLSYTEFISAMLVEGITLAGILIWYAASIHRLHRDLSRISQGNLEHRCDPSRLPPGLRGFGSELNSSAEGMERAVEEKMKSERFKTELITNVSHDIKTPITSIVNYVDLMKKETVENETVKGYLEVLDRQSLRLKKLAEDLVESSKATSGVLPVTLAPCDLRVLLEQALAEYQESFSGKNLEICFSAPENAGFIMADGKHLWRIVDNLLGNVVKYALSGTRVYVNLEYGEEVQVVFRNISEKALALSGEELSERFVRGDASRNTEGSGLGLAIARSLTELQNGKMKISVDGDLFKVTLSFRPIQ